MSLTKRRVERLEDQIEENFFLLAAIIGILILAVLSALMLWGS